MWQIPLVLRQLRSCLNQICTKSIHDSEFRLFGLLRDLPGLVLDIGSNQGNSALSILVLAPRLRVFSMEPLVWLWPCLAIVKLRHWRRYSFLMKAADKANGTATLLVPVGGRHPMTARSSLVRSEFARRVVRQALDESSEEPWSLHPVPVATVRIDELAMKPDLVKLDVEGSEARVLAGMEDTLERCKPALFIEINRPEGWLPVLQARGYTAWTLEPENADLRPFVPHQGDLNLLLLHPQSPSAISRRLYALTRSTPPPGGG